MPNEKQLLKPISPAKNVRRGSKNSAMNQLPRKSDVSSTKNDEPRDGASETVVDEESDAKTPVAEKHVKTPVADESDKQAFTSAESSQPGTSSVAKTAGTEGNEPASPSAPKKSLWKTMKAATVVGAADGKAEADTPKATLKSVAQRVNRQIKAMTLIKQWTQMTSHSQFSNNQDHLNYLRNVAKHATIDLPDPLIATVREEVYPILQDTLKQYKMELGANHHLTQEMQKTINRMKEEMSCTSTRETRRDNNIFRRLSNVFTE